jgi:hypothetical protein
MNKIPKIGEWWVIKRKPDTYSDSFGVCGLREVNFPYIFQVKQVQESYNFHGYSLGDGKYGWSFKPGNENLFQKANLSDLTLDNLTEEQMIEVAKEHFVEGTEFYCAHDKDGSLHRKQIVKNQIKLIWENSSERILVIYYKGEKAGCSIYNRKDGWSEILNSTKNPIEQTMKIYKVDREKLSRDQCNIVNEWANEQELAFKKLHYSVENAIGYSANTGYIFSTARKDHKSWFHVFSNTDGDSVSNDYTEVTFDVFYNEIIKENNSQLHAITSVNNSDVPVVETFSFNYPKKQPKSLPKLTLQIPTFNFNK